MTSSEMSGLLISDMIRPLSTIRSARSDKACPRAPANLVRWRHSGQHPASHRRNHPMRFGLLYELQLPRPWDDRSEHRLIHDALAEVELADALSFDCVWANEHHFLEEYSHSSAPEVFLAAAAARTKQIHVGHAVVLSPPGYNPPARVAERIATLDLVSSGRCEWGTGSSSSRTELEGFCVNAAEKKAMWAEATEQTANML